MPTLRHTWLASLGCLTVLSYGPLAFADEAAFEFHIEQMAVADALQELAVTAHVPLLFPYDQVDDTRANALQGSYTLSEALEVLLQGTGLSGDLTEGGVISIRRNTELQDSSTEDQMNLSLKNALIAGTATVAILTAPAQAQDADAPQEEFRQQTVSVVGSRAKPRTSTESPVAVDTLNIDALLKTGGTETGRILQELVPSFNFSSSAISDGTDSLRPATLRGLGPDQTLVLINGKRRHKSALIHVNTSVGRGAAGTDINAIPSSAIRQVDVLRDGASALYGSDAIAGVLNFELKNADSGGTVTASLGQTFESDGTTFTASINKGFAFGEDGFLNATYEYRNRENTNRAGLSARCQFLCTNIDVTGDGVPDVVADDSTVDRERAFDRQNFRIGDSDSEQHVIFLNAGMSVSDNAQAYAFGSYGTRENESGGFYRRANDPVRVLVDFYPDGTLPLIKPQIEDVSLDGGIDWTFGDMTLDTSAGYGSNEYEFIIGSSNNVSLGLGSPTEVSAGTLKLQEWRGNADMTMPVAIADSVVAFGIGLRKENYQLIAGEPASFANGGFFNESDLNNDGTPDVSAFGGGGIQVFPGFQKNVDEDRDSYGAYVELDTDWNDAFNTQVAARFENYDGFGDTLTWKLAAKYDFTDAVAIRGGISSGFRAPSMQQLFFTSSSTQFILDPVTNQTIAVDVGTLRNDSAEAAIVGVPQLEEETSLNYSLGAVFTPGNGLSVTIDAYKIDIDDRIMLSSRLTSGVVNSSQFFVNGANTETEGVDIVGSYDLPDDVFGGDMTLSASANFTSTDVVSRINNVTSQSGQSIISEQDVSIIEEWQPESRINFGLDYDRGPWGTNISVMQYGEYTVCESSTDCNASTNAGAVQTFGSKWLVDAQIDYRFEKGLTLSFGGNNIFDETPDVNTIGQTRSGSIYDSAGNLIVTSPGVFHFSRRSAPFGFNGGYYYARASFDF